MGNLRIVETCGRVEGYEGLREYGDTEGSTDVGWNERLGDILYAHIQLHM